MTALAQTNLPLPQQTAEMWVKTRFWREGPWFKATAYLTMGGETEILNFAVDTRPIVAWFRKRPRTAAAIAGESVIVGGFPKSLFKKVNQIAKNKIVRAVGKGVKAVVRSKITAGIVAAVAVVYPPVGVAAGAALAAANYAYDVIDKAEKIKKDIEKKFPGVKKAINNIDNPKKALGELAKGLPQAALSAAVMKSNLPLPKELGAAAKFINSNPEVKNALALSAKAKVQVSNLVNAAKTGNKEALEGVRILKIAQDTKNAIKQKKTVVKREQSPGAFKAVLIDRRGSIVPGTWLDESGKGKANGAILLRGKQVYKGSFNKIGCYPRDGEIGIIPCKE